MLRQLWRAAWTAIVADSPPQSRSVGNTNRSLSLKKIYQFVFNLQPKFIKQLSAEEREEFFDSFDVVFCDCDGMSRKR